MTPEDLTRLKDIMVSRGLKLAIAESLTVGNVQCAIGSISGASNFFEGGITAYNLDQKVRHLGVDRAHAESCNCVSSRVAAELARGVAASFDADVGVGTTGYAEPWPEEGVSVPHAFFAICRRDRVTGVAHIVGEGRPEAAGLSRVAMQHRVTETVLGALVDYLVSLD